MNKLIPLLALVVLAVPSLAFAQSDDTPTPTPTPQAQPEDQGEGQVDTPEGTTGEGATELQNLAPDQAVQGLAPVDPSVYVDAFATLVDPGGETADSVARAAVETAPQMEARRASVRSAEHTRDRQWLNYMPQIGVSFGYTRLSEVPQPELGGFSIPPGATDGIRDLIAMQQDGDPVHEASAAVDAGYLLAVEALADGSSFSFPQVLDRWALQGTLSYPVTDLFLTLMPNYSAFEGFAEAERLQLDSDRANVDLRARESYYAHVRAQATLAVALAAQRQTEANRAQVEALVRAGVSPRVDLMRVEAQNAAARVGVARSQGAVMVTAHIVRTLMHVGAAQGPIPVGENLAVDLPEVDESREDLVQQALESRAEMLAIRRLIGAREDIVSARGGTRWPQIFIQAQAEYQNPNNRVFPQTEEWYGSWSVGAVLQYTINQSFEGDQIRSRAQAEADQSRADLNALRDAVTIEVDQSYEQFNAARTALTAAGAGLQASEEAYRVRQEELAAGTAVARDLVDAESDLTRARIDLVDSIIDVRVAYAQLRRAVSR